MSSPDVGLAQYTVLVHAGGTDLLEVDKWVRYYASTSFNMCVEPLIMGMLGICSEVVPSLEVYRNIWTTHRQGANSVSIVGRRLSTIRGSTVLSLITNYYTLS